jgi:hypothetical protein
VTVEGPPVVAVLGVGLVGGRIARELVSCDEPLHPLVSTSRPTRAAALREAFGPDATVVVVGHGTPVPLPESVRVVVLAGAHHDIVGQTRGHLRSGRSVITLSDDCGVVADLLGLDDEARSHGCEVVVGAAFSPGLSCLLAAHGATAMDLVDEVRVAKLGTAGPACARRRLQSMRHPATEWRDGEWLAARPGSGRELCWFPDPVAGRDCYRVSSAEPLLLRDAFASLQRASVRAAMSRRDRLALPLPVLLPAPAEGGIGAIRVEVRGSAGGERRVEVLGVLDRPAVAAGAVAAEAVAGVLRGDAPAGAHGMASWPEPTAVLRALWARGVRVAAFEGG